MKNLKIVLWAVSLLAVLVPLFPQDKFVSEYRIGPKDLIEISVFGVQELNRTIRVSEDGKITLPLLGEIDVNDLTATELEKRLSGLLGEKMLQNPLGKSKPIAVAKALKSPLVVACESLKDRVP